MKNSALTHWLLQPDGLATRLRQLRNNSGLAGKDLAMANGWQPSKVSRLENGTQLPKVQDIQQWADACGATAETANELLELLDEAQALHVAWRQRLHGGQTPVQAGYRQLLQESRSIRYFETAWVPGILQIADYTHRVLTEMVRLHDLHIDDVDAAVAQRMERQQYLYDRTKQFEFLLAEPVLYWGICPPDVMANQLDRLQTVIDLPNARFGIVPLSVPLTTTPQNAFQIYDDIAISETFVGETTHDPKASAAYSRALDLLWEEAATGSEARQLIIDAANRLRSP